MKVLCERYDSDRRIMKILPENFMDEAFILAMKEEAKYYDEKDYMMHDIKAEFRLCHNLIADEEDMARKLDLSHGILIYSPIKEQP